MSGHVARIMLGLHVLRDLVGDDNWYAPRPAHLDLMRFPILWQAPSAMYFKPSHHLGGYGCLLAEMRMMMCGGLGGLAVEKSDGVAIA